METLWAERRLLELLLYKLTTVDLIVAARRHRFAGTAARELERILEKVRLTALARAVAVSRVAELWGVPPETLTLRRLARQSPLPARPLLREHRRALVALAADIERISADNGRLTREALAEVAVALASPRGDRSLPGPRLVVEGAGGVEPRRGAPRAPAAIPDDGPDERRLDLHLEEVGYLAVLAALEGVRVPSVLEFLS